MRAPLRAQSLLNRHVPCPHYFATQKFCILLASLNDFDCFWRKLGNAAATIYVENSLLQFGCTLVSSHAKFLEGLFTLYRADIIGRRICKYLIVMYDSSASSWSLTVFCWLHGNPAIEFECIARMIITPQRDLTENLAPKTLIIQKPNVIIVKLHRSDAQVTVEAQPLGRVLLLQFKICRPWLAI